MNTFRRPYRPQRRETHEKHRINYYINAREVRVITDDGEQLGVLQTRAAVQRAEEMGLDLVEVAPNANPPVCKIMDYGKFKYQEQKKEAKAKKNRSEVETKEVRLRYCTDKGDLDTKINHAREFLKEGNKVKFAMRFKGREAMHANMGSAKFDLIIEQLKEEAHLEERSRLMGSSIFMVLAPGKKQVV